MDEQVLYRLRSIVSSRGPSLAGDPRLVRALLGDLCPDRPLEVSLLVTAVEEGATAALLDRPVGLPVDHLTARLVVDLTTARGLSREAAGWAVDGWAFALGAGPGVGPGAGTETAVGTGTETAVATGTADPVPYPAGATTAEVVPVTTPPGPAPEAVPAPDRPPPPQPVLVPADAWHGRSAWVVAGAAGLALLLVAGIATVLLTRGGSDSTAGPTARAAPSGKARSAAKGSANSAGPPGPLIVLAHAGGGETYAEETMPSLLEAARSGAAVEADVRWTEDGVPVMMHAEQTETARKAWIHDPIVCSDRVHVIAKSTSSVLRAHCTSAPGASKDGARYGIPVFDELMKQVSAIPEAQVFVEVKTEQTAAQDRKFLGVIEKYGMVDRTVVTSYFPDALARIAQQAAMDRVTIRRLLFLPDLDGNPLPKASLLAGQGLWGVCVRSDLVTRAYLASLKANHLVALAEQRSRADHKTPRNLTRIWSAMRAAGAAAVLTDQPAAYRRWLR